MQATYFKSAAEFRAWLKANHQQAQELIVGFYRKHSGQTGISYEEAVNEALCFGWIDGLKKRLNEFSYCHRFTPRKPRSTWSLSNIKRAEMLKKQGRMEPAGLHAFEARERKRSGLYSYETRPRRLTPELERRLRAQTQAWDFFRHQPAGYQRLAIYWVLQAKREETRLRRLDLLIGDSARGLRLRETQGKARAGL